MNTLFLRAFLLFLGSLLILAIITTAVFLIGYDRSLEAWSSDKNLAAEEFAASYLQGADGMAPQDIPIFLYDEGKNLIFTNRGLGRLRQEKEADLTPVRDDGRIIGYYSAGAVHFRDDASNDRFIRSMQRVVFSSLAGVFALSLLFALFFSRSLSNPARQVAKSLDSMAGGDLRVTVPEKGAGEISMIARSANRLSRQLLDEQELRRQWAEDLAHDLRTPIAALKAQFEGMKDGVLDLSPGRIAKSLREINQVEKLVLDLEELSRLESPEMVPRRRKIVLAHLFHDLGERFALALQGKSVEMTIEAQGVWVEADETLLQRALSNILSNAVRHVEEGGKIFLSAARNETVVIRIGNTGEPIRGEELPRLYDRLYRGEKARTSPGSGLGLTIAKKIIDIHGGRIRISSIADRGTTVQIDLPVGPPNAIT